MKQGSFVAFLLQLFGLTAILYGVLYMFFTKVMPVTGIPLEVMLGMLFAVTALSHFIIIQSGKKNPRAFTYAFMFTSLTRLVVYGVFIVLYGRQHSDIVKPFVLSFFVLYIIYTVFEIRSVLGYLKGK